LEQVNDDQIRKQLFELINCGKKINV